MPDKERPFRLCECCGQPVLTKIQEAKSLIVFFETDEEREEFRQAVTEANPNLTSYDY